MSVCIKCRKEPVVTRLTKCPACFNYICGKCGIRRYGHLFCSNECAQIFFFGSSEEDLNSD